ncbi:toll/interleukin-1 receptor-like protein [Bidens hawaiensis]|uniref:toll/interleukin-1 receptor-like protein n=1 Tax=Bidens hawaiensis TaxID=980011 RepID=UPI00404AEA93
MDFYNTNSRLLSRSLASSSQSIPSSSPRIWLVEFSISSRRIWLADVSISSRRERHKTFADQLKDALERQQIITYESNGTNPVGPEESSDTVLQNSRIVIIVFTKNYVDSSGCLNELTFIMKNHTTDTRGSIVIPIFHGVEPSEVRSQTGYYGEALAKHKLNNKIKRKVNSWTKALKTAASFSGWDVTNG